MSAELRYLKIDFSMADAFGKALWLPSIQSATPFQRKAEAQSVKNMTPSASGVIQGVDGFFYVTKVDERPIVASRREPRVVGDRDQMQIPR
jgi:hypothetical protein